ncbi:unnamed protein product [Prorocentrum cordatum]|uniref:Uncharacterized protein n=1 Tax=Prorocentrum cordatum TaxID=2364126 RepID=A0ABN9Y200_9DINO|nr:unnamed protein product [Polarella glacialis]
MSPRHRLAAFGCATAAFTRFNAASGPQNDAILVEAADHIDSQRAYFRSADPAATLAQEDASKAEGLQRTIDPRRGSTNSLALVPQRRVLKKILTQPEHEPSSESSEVLDDTPDKDLGALQGAIDQRDSSYKKDIGDDVNNLARRGRFDLLEVCAPPTSRLAQAVHDQGGLAVRAGVHYGFDMSTKTGVHRLVPWIRQHRPRRIVASPPCAADCELQTWNQKTPEDREGLRKKAQQARRIQHGRETVMSIGLQHPGAEIDLEQPQRSQSWSRSDALKRIREQTCETLVTDCAYGRKCPRSGRLLPKVWRICSTDPELQRSVGKRCSNRPGRHDNREHGAILSGKIVASTAFYPEAMCKAWATRALRAGGGTTAGASALLATDLEGDDLIFEGDGADQETEDPRAPNEEFDGDGFKAISKEEGHTTTKEAQDIEFRLSRPHRNLGHPCARTTREILENSGASQQVLKMVENFKCRACDSSALPEAVRTSAGVEIPEVFEGMGSDGLEWTDPLGDAIYLLNLGEGSGITQVANRGDKSQIRLSPGTEMFIAPGAQDPANVEHRIQLFKRTFAKFRKQNHDCDVDEAISYVVHAINDLDKVGSHSPIVHAFGVGGAQSPGIAFAIVDDSHGETRELRRLSARQSFIEVEYSERRRNAEHARSRVATRRKPGELAYYWHNSRGPVKATWYGPARVLVQEQRILAGSTRPTSMVQISREGVLLRRAPEQPRPAAEAKRMVVELRYMESGAELEFIDENMICEFDMLKSELTDSEGRRRLTTQTLDCCVANQKRKDKIEFHWSKLSSSKKDEFRKATTKEVKDPADVIRCRWVLTRKSDGTAKARLVLLGYQTEDIGQEPTASPTASRRARNILLTVAAASSWNIVKGDVTSALLQANDLKKDLFVEALKGIKELYTWGTWKDMDDGIDSVEQCGVSMVANDRGFFQHQQSYIDKLMEIIPKHPKARPSDRLSEADLGTLRTWCDALSWLDANTLPWMSAPVADVQSKIPTGDYKLFGIANNITKTVKANRTDGIQIFRHSLPGCGPGLPDFRVFTWCDAAWASRPDGHSQGKHVTALSTSEGPFHHACDFTVLDWGSRKLKRVARSSLSAEIQEASDAEGEQMMVRLAMYDTRYEVLYGRFDLNDRRGALHRVPGALVTDCKAFYDGVVTSGSAGLGLDERRTAIEALALRRALEEGGTIVRWVHSHAQLADGMTKASLQAFNVLHAFLKNQRWNIVHDERFLSARKRSALGKGIFDETTDTHHSEAKKIMESRRRDRPAASDVAAAGATDKGLEQISFPPV